MLLGGAVIVLLFAVLTQKTPFNFDIFYSWLSKFCENNKKN
jgi:hypothetical protein